MRAAKISLVTTVAPADGTFLRRVDDNDLLWEHLFTPQRTVGDLLAATEGDWLAFADVGDSLADDAFRQLLAAVGHTGSDDVVMAYTDHDVVDHEGTRCRVALKPSFSPERLRHCNYIGPGLVVIRRDRLAELPRLDAASAHHELLLRVTERGGTVEHVPSVLYHRSAAHDDPPADAAAVEAHLARCGIRAVARPSTPQTLHITRSLVSEPLVSVIIPTGGSTGTVWGVERCFVHRAVRSIAERSSYRNVEFVVVADRDTDPDVEARVRRTIGDRLRWLTFEGAFNFSAKINTGARAAAGEVLLLLNDDTELIEASSIDHMVGLLQHGATEPTEPVGAVGARLLFEDGTLQHGGHVYHHQMMHACVGWRGNAPGPHRVLATPRECSGVTAAALMVPTAVFHDVGGFPEELPLHFNDVAFCLALRATGRRIVWSPHAAWYHFEGRTRTRGATIDEYRWITDRWPEALTNDPYYHPLCEPGRSDWVLAERALP
jgi:GT2 family glycosyltransferase